jgi:hypothetical protein
VQTKNEGIGVGRMMSSRPLLDEIKNIVWEEVEGGIRSDDERETPTPPGHSCSNHRDCYL